MRTLVLLGLCLLAAGCAGLDMKQGSKSMARREIPPGPGLLTGSQGEFVIFRLEGEPRENASETEPAQPGAAGEVAQ
jgi:hypothetical protein